MIQANDIKSLQEKTEDLQIMADNKKNQIKHHLSWKCGIF